VVSVHNGGDALRACLASLAAHKHEILEFIVADDGSTDGAVKYAEEFGARIIRVGSRRGPANGRNLGALAAQGDIILFLDADVCVHEDTISRIRQRFEAEPELGALFGAYDTQPEATGLVSQFRNLLRCFVHRTGSQNASTFWTGCGAIRREIFLESQGFDLSYSVPCIEDIELGMRLVKKNIRIALDPAIQVKHLKNLTMTAMVKTDIQQRGIPWTLLILESGKLPNDLNVSWANRLSVATTFMMVLLVFAALLGSLLGMTPDLPVAPWAGLILAPALLLGAVVALNGRFYRFLAEHRGLGFASASVPLHLIYFLCCGLALIAGVAIHFGSRWSSPGAPSAVSSAAQSDE